MALHWISAMSVEGQVLHVLAATTFLLAAKYLIHAESATETILAATLVKILVLIALGDSWTLAEFVVETINLAPVVMVFWSPLRSPLAPVWLPNPKMFVEFAGVRENHVQVATVFHSVVRSMIFAGSATLLLRNAIFVPSFQVASKVLFWIPAVHVYHSPKRAD